MVSEKRSTFGGKLAAVLVTAGGSVGLGNIWRFPYVTGENRGSQRVRILSVTVFLLRWICPVLLFCIFFDNFGLL